MAIEAHFKSYSIYDLKIAPVTGDTPGTLVDVPGIQECTIKIATDSTELRGDNMVIATANQGNNVEFEFTAAGTAIPVLEKVFGGTATDTGTTPAVVRRFDVKAADPRPYITIVGFTKNDAGTESMDVIVWKAKVDGEINLAEWKDNEFETRTFSGTGVAPMTGGNAGIAASLIQKETAGSAAALPA